VEAGAAGCAGAVVAGAAAGAQAATNIDNTNITAINDQNFLDILLLLTEFEIRELKRMDRKLVVDAGPPFYMDELTPCGLTESTKQN
jgi:hypothetical protein